MPFSTTAMVCAGAVALVLGTLYLYAYTFKLLPFWEYKMRGTNVSWMLWSAGVLLLAHGSLICWISRTHDADGRNLTRPSLITTLSKAWLAPTLAVLVSITYTYLRFSTNSEISHASLHELTVGTGWTPFQFRVLVPWLVGGLHDLGAFPDGNWRLGYILVEVGATLLIYLTFARWIDLYFERQQGRWLAFLIYIPLYFTFASPIRVNAFYYPWDTPSVAFFIVGLYLIQQKQWGIYYVVFALATLNRETACFLTVIYALTAVRREGWSQIGLHVSAQLVVWVLIKAGLALFYQDNPIEDRGEMAFVDQSLFISMWARNVNFLTNPLSFLYLVTAMGGIWLPVLLCARRIGSSFVQRALWVTVPFGIGMSYVGLLGEYRIFGELVPLYTLALLLLVFRHSVSGNEYGEQASVAASSAIVDDDLSISLTLASTVPL